MKQQRAFTLLELSIVLVIIGLLVGGVIVGQSMIRTAEMRSITTDYQKYATAIKAFRDQYNALPGDMNDAVDFWGKDNVTCSGAAGSVTVPGTCNGDGDNLYNYYYREQFLAWQHLGLSKLIDGAFGGNVAGGYTLPAIGTDIPKGKMEGTAWTILSLDPTGNNLNGYYTDLAGGLRNYLVLGTIRGTGYGGLFLTPQEMSEIDKKIDDGKPATGIVGAGQSVYTGIGFGSGQCTTSSNSVTAKYEVTNPAKQCAPVFSFPK